MVGEIRIKSENAKFRMVSTSEGNASLTHAVQELKKKTAQILCIQLHNYKIIKKITRNKSIKNNNYNNCILSLFLIMVISKHMFYLN